MTVTRQRVRPTPAGARRGLFVDGWQMVAVAVFSWTFTAGTIALVGVVTADDKLRWFLASTTAASLVCGFAAGVMLSVPSARTFAALTLIVSVGATPAWVLWPIPAVGAVLAVMIFAAALRSRSAEEIGEPSSDDTQIVFGRDVAEIAEQVRRTIESERRRRGR